MALSREEIVNTALRLLDEHGLDALTLRRLASELGISAPTLYWHIKDKRELLDLVAERFISERHAEPEGADEDTDPWEHLAKSFRRQYQAITAHRDGARVFAGHRPTAAMLPEIDKELGFWVALGFSPGEALTSIISIGNFVTGAALAYEAESQRPEPDAELKKAHKRQTSIYPNLGKAVAGREPDDPPVHQIAFETGLALIISGLKARHMEHMAEK